MFKMREELFQQYENGIVDLAPHMTEDLDDVINHGLSNVGMYHAKRPLVKNQDGDLVSEDLNLLYYYRNRLEGYDLEKIS
jgi:glycerol-3-phosphate O-acyltransferase